MSAGCSEYCANKGCQREAGCPAGGLTANTLSTAEVRAIQFQADTDRAQSCCNHDCSQGDDCPNRAASDTEGPGALVAALMCALAMLFAGLCVIAVVVAAGSYWGARLWHPAAHTSTASAAAHTTHAAATFTAREAIFFSSTKGNKIKPKTPITP